MSANRVAIPAKRVARVTFWALSFINASTALTIWLYLQVVAPVPTDNSTLSNLQDSGISFLAFTAIVVPMTMLVSKMAFRPTLHWLSDSEPPTSDERRSTLAYPYVIGAWSLVTWVLAAIVFGAANLSADPVAFRTARVALAILLGGLMASSTTFLITERLLRPIYGLVLTSAPLHKPRTLGIYPRILISWALAAGLPLLAIASLPIGREGASRSEILNTTVFIAAVCLITGLSITAMSARAIADPLLRLRKGFDRVKNGDLSASMTVDDGGEIGQLQSGFNEMVKGLRERQELQDLFGRHVGTAVAKRAITSGIALGGTSQEVTALFVDIAGSTALATRESPERVVKMLNEFFEVVVTSVGAEQGWVNKFEGDGALCIFGAPEFQEDHRDRALRAAIAIRRSLLRRSERGFLDAGIGVSSGTAVAGNVGALERFEFTIIGDPVNEASRLTDHSKLTSLMCLASEATIELARPEARAEWKFQGETLLRGRTQPTRFYSPTAEALDLTGMHTP